MNNLDVIKKIESWAEDRNLIAGSTPQAQMLKLTEELGELAHAIARKDEALTIDAIGDCAVVLTIIAKQIDTNLTECLEVAYYDIKDRKGKMVDGVFVKELGL